MVSCAKVTINDAVCCAGCYKQISECRCIFDDVRSLEKRIERLENNIRERLDVQIVYDLLNKVAELSIRIEKIRSECRQAFEIKNEKYQEKLNNKINLNDLILRL